MPDHLIPDSEVQRYARGPSQTTVSSVAAFQDAIRDALGSDYETFLQGSYKNDTSIRDINDVDIVAVLKFTSSGAFSGRPVTNYVSWADIFAEVRGRLDSASFRGRTSIGDKCVHVNADWSADVVPAVTINGYDRDPIAIYSFREQAERKNYPRVHYENGVRKQQRTGNAYKPTVRMFKAWAANHWANDPSIAPSFYVECVVYNATDSNFGLDDLASTFFYVGYRIESNFLPTLPRYVSSVAEDKDILVESEWKLANYSRFHAQLTRSTSLVLDARNARNQAEAVRLWRAAFNE